MAVTEKIVNVKDYLTKSNLPVSDYVINPYVGCPHGCKYCYASFMKRFTAHDEPWGDFVDIKLCGKPIDTKKISGKEVFLSSVTDCYNYAEEEHKITRSILKQLLSSDCKLSISTKSKLILRDLDLLKQFDGIKVSMSLNTLDDKFRSDMDNASSVQERLDTLRTLHENGLYTVLFISPIFPEITDVAAIMDASKGFIDEYWVENLNLRGGYKKTIMDYIAAEYPQLSSLYDEIYRKHDLTYWKKLSDEIDAAAAERNVKCTNFFYHEMLVKAKKARKTK